MLVDKIKAQALSAMKKRDTVSVTILRLAQGEIQQNEARANRSFSDEEASAILKKMIKSNEETAQATQDQEKKNILLREIEILAEFLPKKMSVMEIKEALKPVLHLLQGAQNVGQATGIAMKQLKEMGAVANGSDVASAVSELRV